MNQQTHSAFEKRVRRHVTGRVREYFAVTAPGFEAQCQRELAALGLSAENEAVETGGVRFDGRLADCLRANLHLRTATRILMRIAAFTATHLRQVEKKTADIPWSLFLPPGIIPVLSVRTHRSRLYHTGAIEAAMTVGLLKSVPIESVPASTSEKPAQTLFVRVVDDRFVLSLDTSGPPLYKRGLKPGAARAPIRETLAAAILMAAGYDPEKPLVDPLCGSGTFSIEAAMMARCMAPGANRTFAFMDWPGFSARQWEFLKKEALAQITPLPFPRIFASDIDAGACDRLARHTSKNSLSDAIQVRTEDFFQLQGNRFGPDPGCIVINPPYGVRMGSVDHARHGFEQICSHLAAGFRGWRFALIVPDPEMTAHLPFQARFHPFVHGGLKLTLATGKI
ncbi:hypothetical protein LJC47_02905 [Desulfosarcina sp. OttesenSCG-928-B08]|nr:hypothetical protein [Desulfosarcina sp. OttesenSCG-928-B08]